MDWSLRDVNAAEICLDRLSSDLQEGKYILFIPYIYVAVRTVYSSAY
jgi:hypothetical protein